METLGSSTQKDKGTLYCTIRKERVADLPEERVRQRLLTHLTKKLYFPASCIGVEKNLNQIPHLQGRKLPDRRVDIICYSKKIHPIHEIYPLLTIECKAVPLTDKVVSQIVGYNHYIQSHFIAVANEHEIMTAWFDREKKEMVFIPYLPDYEQLIRSIAPCKQHRQSQ